jgi:cbb3-type cytochrome oxidase subunit 1
VLYLGGMLLMAFNVAKTIGQGRAASALIPPLGLARA